MNANPYLLLESMLPSMHKVEKKIAMFILEHTEETLSMSVQEMSHKIKVAESSIVRFSKTIGYNGFSDLKLNLAKATPRDSSRPEETLQPGDSLEGIARKVFAGNMQTIAFALDMLDLQRVQQAVQSLAAAERILVYGMGAAASVGEDFADRLTLLHLPSACIRDAERMRATAACLNSSAVAVGLSETGQTEEVLQAMQAARLSGAKTIGITNTCRAPLSEACDICLELYCPDSPGLSPRVAQISLIDCLCAALALGQSKQEMHD